MNLANEFQKWISNARRKGKDYELLYPNEDAYKMLTEDFWEDVCNLQILIWENGKLNYQYSWSKGEGLQDKEKVVFVTKKQKKMMLCVEDKMLYSFGNDDKKQDGNQEIFIYRKGTETYSLIFASSQTGKIEQLNEIIVNENKVYATEIVLKQMIKEVVSKQQNGEDMKYEKKC